MTTLNLVLTLSEKEQAIYHFLCQNLSNESIAETLLMSESNVRYHLKSIYRKLGVSSCDKSDLHLCRQRAISYGGTKIEQVIQSKEQIFDSGMYSREDIIKASKKLTWFDQNRVSEILEDLFRSLETLNGQQIKYKVSKKQYDGGFPEKW